MMKAGQNHTLTVTRISDYGLYLADDTGDEVLLPNRYVSLGDKIADPGDFDDVLDKIILKDAIMKLKDRDRKIIILRYFRDRTQSEVAEELGVSQVQISRLENKILKEIGKQLS